MIGSDAISQTFRSDSTRLPLKARYDSTLKPLQRPRVGKESMECKELPNYFPLGPGKVINEEVGIRIFSLSQMTKVKLVCALAFHS